MSLRISDSEAESKKEVAGGPTASLAGELTPKSKDEAYKGAFE